MPRETDLYLGDVVEACRRIRRYTDGLDRAAFEADERTMDAVLRNLEIIGEAAKNLPAATLAGAPDVPWREVMKLRDLLAHAYFRVEPAIIWRIVTIDLPILEAAARRLAAARGSPP